MFNALAKRKAVSAVMPLFSDIISYMRAAVTPIFFEKSLALMHSCDRYSSFSISPGCTGRMPFLNLLDIFRSFNLECFGIFLANSNLFLNCYWHSALVIV